MKNKLIIFSYDFPPSDGGIARLCHEIAAGMQEYYTSVIVLTRSIEGISKLYNFNKVKVLKLPNVRLKCELEAYKYLRGISNKNEYDIITGLWHPEASLALLAGFKNVFILGHGTEFLSGTSFFRKYIWQYIYAKSILSRAKKCIANSDYTLELIKKTAPSSHAVALPLGVNESFFSPNNVAKYHKEKLNIVSVSRILQFKGYDFIAKVIASLPESYKEKIHWNIGGTGPYLLELKELVVELKISSMVTFYGFIPDEELPNFYNANDIFILCTREVNDSTNVEGFGLVFLEAQSCGIPVVGTNTGGISSAIEDGNGGWLIDQDDCISLKNLLKEVIDKEAILIKESKAARKRVLEKYTWVKYCKSLNSILKE
jgi:phosphatidylinositol alpha-1,6-mannosyltransferase